MNIAYLPRARVVAVRALAAIGTLYAPPAFAQDTNACPVDGCQIRITSIEKAGDELRLILEANYKPDMSRNHIHVWWGENFDVKQVSNNAETVHGVKQGTWHPTDEYPVYVTQSGASVAERGDATSLCVSAGDRNHDIIDVALLDCESVANLLE
jgi:hypothetical protein